MSDLYERKKEITILSEVDEADSYEVDECYIALDPITNRFALITASGCSCWDGDFEEEQFDSIDQIADTLLKDERRYNPTLNGARALVAEARLAFEKLGASQQ